MSALPSDLPLRHGFGNTKWSFAFTKFGGMTIEHKICRFAGVIQVIICPRSGIVCQHCLSVAD